MPQSLQVNDLASLFFWLAQEIANGRGPFVVLQDIGRQAVTEKGLDDREHLGGEGSAQNRKRIFPRQESPRFGQSPLFGVSRGQYPVLPGRHRAQSQASGQSHFGSRNRSTSGLSCRIVVKQRIGFLTTSESNHYSEKRFVKLTGSQTTFTLFNSLII